MHGHSEIDFREIREYDGDKRKGFEELICQLARREKDNGEREFRRVEGSGGDGGVEAYWIFEDGTEHGYQAKYFLTTKDIDWPQIDKSVREALKQHPNLTNYTIAIACDLTDRSGRKGRGKTGWEHWETHTSMWQRWADAKEMTVKFIPWTKSDLTDILISSTSNRGLVLYWFNSILFDESWFRLLFERSRADLGERFQPEDHVEVGLSKAFEGLARSPAYLHFLSTWFSSIPDIEDIVSALDKIKAQPDVRLLQDLQDYCAELRGIGEFIGTVGAQPFPLEQWQSLIGQASVAVFPINEWLYNLDSGEKKEKQVEVRKARNCLSEIDSHLDHTPLHLHQDSSHEIRVQADLRRILIVKGEAGSGKSHLFADAVSSTLSDNAPAVLLLGQHFSSQNIRSDFLNFLDLANHGFDEVLQAFNVAGETSRRRLIILIDALNEAHNLNVWRDQLAGFISDILHYEWISIGLSIRPEYDDILIPEMVRKKSVHIICRGVQSPGEKERAAVQYFEKRGITRPAVPWLAPEFSNFLFLKRAVMHYLNEVKQNFPKVCAALFRF